MLLKISVSSAPSIILWFMMEVTQLSCGAAEKEVLVEEHLSCCYTWTRRLAALSSHKKDTTYVLVSQQQTRYLTYISAQLLVQ